MDKLQRLKTKKSKLLYRSYRFFRRHLKGKEIVESEERVEQHGFSRKSSTVELAVILLILSLVSILIWVIVKVFNFDTVPWSQAFTAILSLGVAIVAYRQWRAARHEISIDKYYDRLEVVNKRLECVENEKPTPEDMHVFSELDKLEYVIVKYEYGYISSLLALRALENFKGLCMDREGFSDKSSYWVNKAAYREVTRCVVGAVCEDCQSSQSLND